MGEGAESCDRVVERNIDLYCRSDQILDIFKLLKLILGLDIITIGCASLAIISEPSIRPMTYQ